MVGPVVDRVAPQLTVSGEHIRRAAGHAGKVTLGVHLEQLAAGPGVHRVGRNIDGHIAHDLDALGVGVGLQLGPLLAKLELDKLPEQHLVGVVGGKLGQSIGVAQLQLLGPLVPGLHALLGLDGHVHGVVRQPVLVLQHIGVVLVGQVLLAAIFVGTLGLPVGKRLTQQRKTGVVHRAVVHLGLVAAPVDLLQVGGLQKAFLLQGLKADKVRVARKRGAALVGAVAVAGGAQGQDLPDGLARLSQKVHKMIRLGAEAANAVRAGQAGDRHQNTGFTHDMFPQ